ncbi:hypothetical protein LSO9J_10127 [Candidatus Liberibacter solanacearum]
MQSLSCTCKKRELWAEKTIFNGDIIAIIIQNKSYMLSEILY